MNRAKNSRSTHFIALLIKIGSAGSSSHTQADKESPALSLDLWPCRSLADTEAKTFRELEATVHMQTCSVAGLAKWAGRGIETRVLSPIKSPLTKPEVKHDGLETT
jgi:hypothetical protein